MKSEEIAVGMEVRGINRKSSFLCDKIDGEIISGRLIKKDGGTGKRILKEKMINVYSAQTILPGFERECPAIREDKKTEEKERSPVL